MVVQLQDTSTAVGITEPLTVQGAQWPVEIFQQVLEQAQTGILVVQDLRIAYANPKIAEWTGYTVEALSDGRPLLDLIAPEDHDLITSNMAQRVAGVPGKPYDIRGLRRDGTRFDCRVWGRLIAINGRPAVVIALQDVTEIKQHGQPMAKADQRLPGDLNPDSSDVDLPPGMRQLLGEPAPLGPVGLDRLLAHVPQADHGVVSSICRSEQRVETAGQLRRAVEQDELVVHYQPQVSLASGEIVGMEALVRWQHPEQGLMAATDFVPLAEEAGLVTQIDDWVLRTACRQARAWHAAGLKVQRVSVNLSARQLLQPDVVKHVQAILLEIGVDPRLIGVEVTESTLLDDLPRVTRVLTELKALGLKIALDDFGTGYSSLSHLHNLPIDVVKIDQSFIQGMAESTRSVSMTRAIINMAHSLQIEVLAEGVETEGQLALLVGNRCEFMQGFYFSDALPAQDVEAMLRQGRRVPAALLGIKTAQRTLLLVDDEENIVAALRRALRRDGYHIVTANSGLEGLQRLSEHQVSVIVSDQRMPGMTGVDFLRRAKELYPETVRIVLSGYTELKSITDAINEGAIYKFLTKPWDDEQLREHIAEAFRTKELADENHRLAKELKDANRDLDELNHRLQHLLNIQCEQNGRDRARLAAVYELLECMPVPMLGIDTEGTIAFVNPAAEQMIAPAARLLGFAAAQALSPELLAAAHSKTRGPVSIGGAVYQVLYRDLANGDGSGGQLLVLLP